MENQSKVIFSYVHPPKIQMAAVIEQGDTRAFILLRSNTVFYMYGKKSLIDNGGIGIFIPTSPLLNLVLDNPVETKTKFLKLMSENLFPKPAVSLVVPKNLLDRFLSFDGIDISSKFRVLQRLKSLNEIVTIYINRKDFKKHMEIARSHEPVKASYEHIYVKREKNRKDDYALFLDQVQNVIFYEYVFIYCDARIFYGLKNAFVLNSFYGV